MAEQASKSGFSSVTEEALSVEGMKDLLPNTQPNVEVVEIQRQQEGQAKPKKTSTKQQWGPTIPIRRSSRLIDNGKTVEANAQDFKRKWNLEENKGISHTANKIPSVSKSLLISVAKDIGIEVEDGNPILDKMIDLDNSRVSDSTVACKHKNCKGMI
jgi:hypothetical protein